MRATPPCARMSAGTRSSAITADAPASSAIFACSALTTSMMTPPLSISGKLRLTRVVPVWFSTEDILLHLVAYHTVRQSPQIGLIQCVKYGRITRPSLIAL